MENNPITGGYNPHNWWCPTHQEGCLMDSGRIDDHLECRLEVFSETGSNNFGGGLVKEAMLWT